MNTRNLITQMELDFWKLAIPLLSKSPSAQKLAQFSYQAYTKHASLSLSRKALMWAGAGWVIGLTIGLLSTM